MKYYSLFFKSELQAILKLQTRNVVNLRLQTSGYHKWLSFVYICFLPNYVDTHSHHSVNKPLHPNKDVFFNDKKK